MMWYLDFMATSSCTATCGSPGTGAAAASHGRYRWILLGLCWCAFFLNQADRQAFNVVLPLVRRDLGLDNVAVGLIAGVFSLCFAFALPVAGWASDQHSRKRIIAVALAVWSTATMLTGIANGLIALLIFRSVAVGGGEAFYFPSANSLLAHFHARSRARAMAIHQTSLYVGLVTSGLVAGWIGDHYGWRMVFYAFGMPGLVLVAVWSLVVRDTPPEGKQGISLWRSLPELWAKGLSKRTSLLMAFAYAGMVFVNLAYLTWMPTQIHERFGKSLAEAGFAAMFWHHAFAFVGVLVGGALSDRLTARRRSARVELSACAFLAGAPFLWFLGFGATPAAVYLGLAGFGLFRGLYEANMWAALFDVVPPHLHGQATAALNCMAYILGASSPLILGYARNLNVTGLSLASLGFIYLAGGLALLWARARFLKGDLLPQAAPARE